MIITGDDIVEISSLQDARFVRFEMKRLGEANCFLGLEIKKSDDGYFRSKKDIHQVYCRGFVWRIQEKKLLLWNQISNYLEMKGSQ